MDSMGSPLQEKHFNCIGINRRDSLWLPLLFIYPKYHSLSIVMYFSLSSSKRYRQNGQYPLQSLFANSLSE